MVVCPVCNKENNDEEYCTDCGTKLIDVEKNPNFEFDKNNDISNINELNNYFNILNEKINQQKKLLDELNNDSNVINEKINRQNKLLDELNNDPVIKEYGTTSKINDENNKLRTKIEELENNNKQISSDLNQQRRLNSQLKTELANSKKGEDVVDAIKGIFGGNKNNVKDANFCPHCGKKLF